ncbi:glycosyltransferase family 4 protein [Bacillus circulans]|uniref:glycosyltransferase family 4 protein n=1 Tax=Niallia circulans TaxID=1397 RepID=UPI000300D9F3|nr:glycosyltransferase family 4 protein [Niallia circulans]NRG30019.1 glycosyltransferase family 4 protein [Niallia circulans]
MKNKIGISIIEPVGGHGGMDYYDLSLLNELKLQNDLKVELYTSDYTITNDEYIHKVFRGIYGKTNKYLRAFRFIKGLFKSLNSSKKKKSQIVHYHFFHTSIMELIMVVFAKVYGFKIVVTAHDVESFVDGSSDKISKYIYNQADAIIAHNEFTKNELVKKKVGKSNNIYIIPHGNYIPVVRHDISKDKASLKLGLENTDDKIILFFGQIKEVKGLDILINSIPEVEKHVQNIKLLVAGRPWKDSFTKYMDAIEQANILDKTILHIRYIENNEVDYYFNYADIVVLPYKKIYQSGVLLNALSYKKSVVVSDLPAMKEMITDGENGFIFKSEDEMDLAHTLIKALKNDENLKIIGQNGYNKVLINNDWHKIAKKTAQLYQHI